MNGVANLLILFTNRDVFSNAIAIGQSAVKVCKTQTETETKIIKTLMKKKTRK